MNFKKLTPYLLMSSCLFGCIEVHAQSLSSLKEEQTTPELITRRLQNAVSFEDPIGLEEATNAYLGLSTEQQKSVLSQLNGDPTLSIEQKTLISDTLQRKINTSYLGARKEEALKNLSNFQKHPDFQQPAPKVERRVAAPNKPNEPAPAIKQKMRP